jgi:uncharacterized membrane protein YciS (DUF1049 family)
MSILQQLAQEEPLTVNVNYAILFAVGLILGWLLCHAGVGT